jgi:hypothetical protein
MIRPGYVYLSRSGMPCICDTKVVQGKVPFVRRMVGLLDRRCWTVTKSGIAGRRGDDIVDDLDYQDVVTQYGEIDLLDIVGQAKVEGRCIKQALKNRKSAADYA